MKISFVNPNNARLMPSLDFDRIFYRAEVKSVRTTVTGFTSEKWKS